MQRSRADQLDTMVRRGAQNLGLDIHIPAAFEFTGEGAPLSWVLTNEERYQIGATWDEMLNKDRTGNRTCTINQLQEFIQGKSVDACPDDVM